MSNVATSALAKLARPTLMYGVLSLTFMVLLSISISKIAKKERKGLGYGIVVLGLISSIFAALFNLWIYAKETGMANAAKAKVNAWRAPAAAQPVMTVVAPVQPQVMA